jgi:hypothetical protein
VGWEVPDLVIAPCLVHSEMANRVKGRLG